MSAQSSGSSSLVAQLLEALQAAGRGSAGSSGLRSGSEGGAEVPSIPVPALLDAIARHVGAGSAGGSGSSPSSSTLRPPEAEMQLAEELAANLQRLKAVLAETQDLAERIEQYLGSQGGSRSSGHRPG
jgi:hypothetical protein